MHNQTRASGALAGLIEQLRIAQRELVRELGITRGMEGELGATLVQCHALIEIERTSGLTPGELGTRLVIEQSTASRLVERLRESGWVNLQPDPLDARRRRLSLTKKGQEQVRRGNRRANEEAAAALSLLPPSDRLAVLRGVQLYAKALARKRRLDTIEVREAKAADAAAIKELVVSTLAEFNVLGRPNPQHDADLEHFARYYRRPAGVYYVADDGRVVGGAGIAAIPGVRGGCELRKMYLHRSARGIGLGRVLLGRCLAAAEAAGYVTCYLNTLSRMTDAIRLYEAAGFQQCASPVTDKSDTSGCDRWYALPLGADKADS